MKECALKRENLQKEISSSNVRLFSGGYISTIPGYSMDTMTLIVNLPSGCPNGCVIPFVYVRLDGHRGFVRLIKIG